MASSMTALGSAGAAVVSNANTIGHSKVAKMLVSRVVDIVRANEEVEEMRGRNSIMK